MAGFVAVIGWMAVSMLPPPLSAISGITGLRFPKGSILLHSSEGAWLSSGGLRAKVELPTDKVRGFLASLPQPHELSSTDALGMVTRGPKWWRPGSSRDFIAIRYDGTAAELKPKHGGRGEVDWLNLLIAFDQGPVPVLYVDWGAMYI